MKFGSDDVGFWRVKSVETGGEWMVLYISIY